ncbi:MAG: hypothetical protein Q9226_005902 [Calogaya cf. arnoldii]
MRLLELGSHGEVSLTRDFGDDVPRYSILSHTWGADDEEVTFNDLREGLGRGKVGHKKIEFCGNQARKDGLQYFWVDTCCIDKANHSELSEAITSMFRWYRGAVKCYVYLSDVSARKRDNDAQTQHTWESAFRTSRWFTRGWTLQELLAPESVEFFSREEELLGDKKVLEQQLHQITGIPVTALHGGSLSYFSISERMRWAANRHTKKKEDQAYCLLGIFDVSMSLRYGEGEKALARLEKKVNGSSNRKCRSPKGDYPLVQEKQPCLEKVKAFASNKSATVFAYHYCSISDPDSQRPVNILGSLVAQISAWQPSSLKDLKGIFERDKARKKGKTLQVWELEQVLVKHIATFSAAIILFDALNESEDFFGTVACILSLLRQLPNLKALVTSTRSAATAGTNQWPHLVEVQMNPDEDIRTFVEANLSDHVALRYLSPECMEIVRSVLIGKADQT